MKSFMRLKDFNYNLPQSLIAQKPVRPRDHSRLLVIETQKEQLKHHRFYEIEKFLQSGDVLILNDSKVLPARLIGKKPSGGRVEILLLKEVKSGRWEALIKNLKEKTGLEQKIVIRRRFTALAVKNSGGGIWDVQFNLKGRKLKKALAKFGLAPVPPYIKRLSNLKEYQTVYAKKLGSAAAPTAGFHFTKRLIGKLKKKGVKILFVTLHVGLGTFQPIKTEDIKRHKVYSEWAAISRKTARAINRARMECRRIIAVGTTTARTLESFAGARGFVKAGKKEVDLFILPGYKFKVLDSLITNFHLPKTTLLLLVSAFLGFKEKNQAKGRRKLFRAYNEAIKRKYRFYSFGDAMMII